MMWKKTLLIAGLVLASASPAAAFDWNNRLPRLLEEGVESYESGDYETARDLFHDARLEAPTAPEPVMDLGLTAAKMGQHEEAIALFNHAHELAEKDTAIRAKSLYNRALSQFDLARQAAEAQKRGEAVEMGVAALKSFDETLQEQADFPDAEYNREQVRNFMVEVAKAQEQPQPGDGDEQDQQQNEDGDQQKDQQDQQGEQEQKGDKQDEQEGQPKKDQDGEQQDKQQEQQQKQGEEQEEQPGQPEQSEEKPGEKGEPAQPEEGEGQQGGMQQVPVQMSEEEAKNMLNLLGNRGLLILRQPMDDSRRNRQDW